MTGRDDGYAMVAAVAAIALFSLLAFQVLAASRGAVASVAGEAARARLEAAADAGVNLAVRGLLVEDPAQRWPTDGRPRTVAFDGTTLVITVADERGRIPISDLEEDQARRLFTLAGARGEQLVVLTESYLDWIDDDEDPRPNGAEAPYYLARGWAPRNAPMKTVGELGDLRGMTPEVYARIEPLAATFLGSALFNRRAAAPSALAVMVSSGADSPEAIEAAREEAGQRTALQLLTSDSLVGRPLRIRVVATRPGGDRLDRFAVVEATGQADRPFVIRSVG